ncbi:hypothetical protein N7462_007963 [Penicillium macrosclerotiorum]|uniref:uncharacterized protein n=1 Tax=Penicillium macrosclerotiorum TaxID=303699 RepID=UPI002547C075|nr:uncharacterized protein N7462_007963 [Penicillium macrosclerotiorum]KAJ5679719.1 hypothetical protein N7462_007963 [Penicillium macrosclerotiorum]
MNLEMVKFLSLLIFFPVKSLAEHSSHPVLEGWQFDDNSRSSWDILWACLSTIFACTWTALHIHVYSRDQYMTTAVAYVMKGLSWFGALLAPEVMIIIAAIDVHYARAIIERCNKAFEAEGNYTGIPKTEIEQAQISEAEMNANKRSLPWTMAHGFCIHMDGFRLRTKDHWFYNIGSKNVAPLIEAGLIQPSDLSKDEIKDRAKADALAKFITVLQSLWTLVNILARAAYKLPISPLEISTIAYVVCAACTYGLWWSKPRDMETPITINLAYTRNSESMPHQVREILDADKHCWYRTGERKKKNPVPPEGEMQIRGRHIPWSVICSNGTLDRLSNAEETRLTIWAMVAVQIFCAIHIVAYVALLSIPNLRSKRFTVALTIIKIQMELYISNPGRKSILESVIAAVTWIFLACFYCMPSAANRIMAGCKGVTAVFAEIERIH